MEKVFVVRQGYTAHDKDCLPCAEEPWHTAKVKWAPTGPYSWQPGPYSWQPWIFDPMVQICARHLYKNNNPKTLDPCLSFLPTPCATLSAPSPLLPPSSRRPSTPSLIMSSPLLHGVAASCERWPATAERPPSASSAGPWRSGRPQ
jgi:hypothetical protein